MLLDFTVNIKHNVQFILKISQKQFKKQIFLTLLDVYGITKLFINNSCSNNRRYIIYLFQHSEITWCYSAGNIALSIQTFHKSTSKHYEIYLTKRILPKRLKQWIVGAGLYLYYAFVYSDPQRIHTHNTSCSPSNYEGLFRLQ